MSNWKIQVSSCSLWYSVSLKTRLCLYGPLVEWWGSCELKAVWNGLDLIYLMKLLYYSWCQSKMNQLVGIREEKNLKIYEQLFLQVRTPETGADKSSRHLWKAKEGYLSLTTCRQTSKLKDPGAVSKFSCLLSGEEEPNLWSCMRTYLQFLGHKGNDGYLSWMYLFLNINDPSVYRDSSKAGNRTENTIYIPISNFDTDAGIQKNL